VSTATVNPTSVPNVQQWTHTTLHSHQHTNMKSPKSNNFLLLAKTNILQNAKYLHL